MKMSEEDTQFLKKGSWSKFFFDDDEEELNEEVPVVEHPILKSLNRKERELNLSTLNSNMFLSMRNGTKISNY